MKFATLKSDKWQVANGRNVLVGRRAASCHMSRITCRVAAFTLAEVLAAMLFLAIVIPAAVEALHVASLSGEVAVRKGVAARLADRVLSESVVTTNWNSGTQSGTVADGSEEFRWTLTSQTWPVDAMQLLTVEVKYAAQGHDYSVKLSTLANPLTLTMTGAPQ